MGYRSDIVIVVDDDLVPAFREVLEANNFTSANPDDSPDRITLYGIKWYADYYEDVKALAEWLATQDCEKYGFIRVGEDYDDIETGGSPYDFGLYVERTIRQDG